MIKLLELLVCCSLQNSLNIKVIVNLDKLDMLMYVVSNTFESQCGVMVNVWLGQGRPAISDPYFRNLPGDLKSVTGY